MTLGQASTTGDDGRLAESPRAEKGFVAMWSLRTDKQIDIAQ